MKQLHNTVRIQIPPTLAVSYLITSLEIGHGYTWTRLLSTPKLLIHGRPPIGTLPEILIYGKDVLLENGEEYLVRFRRMLHALAQQNQLTGGR